MSDLISRSKFISVLEYLEKHSLTGKIYIANAIYILENQPNAYDVDKVVEELEKESYAIMLDGALVSSKKVVIDAKRAIGIVRQGGKEILQ